MPKLLISILWFVFTHRSDIARDIATYLSRYMDKEDVSFVFAYYNTYSDLVEDFQNADQ